MEWTAEDIKGADIGEASGAFTAHRVTIDSRQVQAGDLFVAIEGERFDGHDFIKEAAAKDAAAAMVSRVPEGAPPDFPLIKVEDTLKGLQALGRAALARSKARVVAVTGSVGKTGTKEMLRVAFERVAATYASYGNFNNHIGLPLNLANLPEETEVAVLELGMNHAGELAELTRIARPDVAVITNVEAVHLENFDSVEGVADAKAEIFEGVGPGGVAILNRDNAYFLRLQQKATNEGVETILTFGENEKADARLLKTRLTDTGTEIEAELNEKKLKYRLGTHGRHWAAGSLAVLLALEALGYEPGKAMEALAGFTEPEGRGKLYRLTLPQGKVTLIDDSYNASPVAMRAAFATLAAIGKQRKIAVLGDMLELGDEEAALHAELAQAAAEHDIDQVYATGPLMKHLYQALDSERQGAYAKTVEALAEAVKTDVRDGDAVLVKGSRGSRTDVVVKALLQLNQNPVTQEEAAGAL